MLISAKTIYGMRTCTVLLNFPCRFSALVFYFVNHIRGVPFSAIFGPNITLFFLIGLPCILCKSSVAAAAAAAAAVNHWNVD